MMTFSDIFKNYEWREIPGCTGRYVLKDIPPQTTPEVLTGSTLPVTTFITPFARDTVIVIRLTDGGIISYKRKDGSFCHTLNTPEGFSKKLNELGIAL